MSDKDNRPEDDAITLAILKLLVEIDEYSGTDEEYAKMVDQLTKLYKLKETPPKKRVSPDTLVAVSGNVLIALIVIGYEQRNVVTTKALNFMSKIF